MARKAPKAVDDIVGESTQDFSGGTTPPSEDTINQRIAEAAYYRAEKRGFVPGYEVEDWLEAEKEIRSAALD
ncbi:DUF2934 domain-containing protein [Methylocaldum szegediense]|jgi:hypothetical protein|uniref:DUF2934 domain-containing protein n=1 Tax=Methylocaldum szegediense TaxID=73780 RepID=A0ABN8X628_9GAMM|nr:DUF2934 domain-containing protein [Methylocaldum szegediense]CAI8801662.1 conserved protein of unknown function [Methylocaldum szegediense]